MHSQMQLVANVICINEMTLFFLAISINYKCNDVFGDDMERMVLLDRLKKSEYLASS